MDVLLVYAGLLLCLLGAFAMWALLPSLGIRTRTNAALVLGIGIVTAAIGASFPAKDRQISEMTTRLDGLMPTFQFRDVHSTMVEADPATVFRSVKEVTADEILLYRLLTWLRSPRLGPVEESILAPRPNRPLLDVATSTGFDLLEEEPGREIVLGIILGKEPLKLPVIRPEDVRRAFLEFERPGYSKVTFGFRIEDLGDRVHLTTETRVYATDASARRSFAAYWRLIRPGSVFIRLMWLRAVRIRAEEGPPVLETGVHR